MNVLAGWKLVCGIMYVIVDINIWQFYVIFPKMKIWQNKCFFTFTCQRQKDCFLQSLNIIEDRSWKLLSLELGLQACQLPWNFWIKAMRFCFFLNLDGLWPTYIIIFWNRMLLLCIYIEVCLLKQSEVWMFYVFSCVNMVLNELRYMASVLCLSSFRF